VPIKFENFDGVTAPALPGGWTFGASLVTSASPTGGISPISGSNVLALLAPGNNTHEFGVWGTPDSNSGNVVVSGHFNAAATTANQTFGVIARASATSVGSASGTYYWAQLSPNGLICRLYSVVAGSQTAIQSVTLSSLAEPAWYFIRLSCNGSALTVEVQRESDGHWLNSGGSFQSAAAVAISATDSSVTGAGYAGLTLQSRSDNAYADDWTFDNYSGGSVGGGGIGGGAGGRLRAGLDSGPLEYFTLGASAPREALRAPYPRLTRRRSAPATTTPGIVAFASSVMMVRRGGHGAARMRGGRVTTGTASPAVSSTSGLPSAASVLKPTGRPARPHGGSVRTGAGLPPPTPGDALSASGAFRPTTRVIPPRRGSVQIGRAFTLPETAAAPGGQGVFQPTRRREPPPGRGCVRLATLLHFVPPIDGLNPQPGIFAPTHRREPPPRRGRTTSAPGGIAWLHFVPPIVPGPIAWPMSRSAHVPFNRRELPPRRYQPLATYSQRISIGPGLYYNIYSDTGTGDPINYDVPIATVTVTTWTSGGLAFPGTWKFGVRAMNEWGIERNLDCAVTIILDQYGNDITNRPMPPVGLRAFALPAGAVRVEWGYSQVQGPTAPQGFNVYCTAGTVISYGSPAVVVPASASLFNMFQSQIAGLTDGTTYTIGVRAYNTSGEEPNTTTVQVVADASGPLPVSGLIGVAVV